MNSIAPFALALAILCIAVPALAQDAPREIAPSLVFPLAQPVDDNLGGILVHDLDNDGQMDYLVTSPGHIGAYGNDGTKLWVSEAPIRLFEFSHHPSLAVGDLDGDGTQDVAFLATDKTIRVLTGTTGEIERTLSDIGEPIAIAIANLRGRGDRELLLQYSQTSVKALNVESGAFLWETDAYKGIEHSPLRQADIDGDGLDEIAGASFIDHDGTLMNDWDLGDTYRGMDSIVIADIVPGLPLEAALAEQRGANSHTVVVNPKTIVYQTLNPWDWEDPDKVCAGNFDPRPGLEVFNRSSGGDGTTPRSREKEFRHELAPWVLDAKGDLITKYYLSDAKPAWWTGSGIESIFRIDWDGSELDFIAAKERHKNGAGAVVNPMTGAFIAVFPAKAMRFYVADVSGDYREEAVIVDEDGTVKVFTNPDEPLTKDKPRYWDQQHYRRQKQNWNYYSP
jgi:hypothetical protein